MCLSHFKAMRRLKLLILQLREAIRRLIRYWNGTQITTLKLSREINRMYNGVFVYFCQQHRFQESQTLINADTCHQGGLWSVNSWKIFIDLQSFYEEIYVLYPTKYRISWDALDIKNIFVSKYQAGQIGITCRGTAEILRMGRSSKITLTRPPGGDVRQSGLFNCLNNMGKHEWELL